MRVADIPDEYRRQGTTTRQMMNAPQCALFVWPVADLSYPKALAHYLGRGDLLIAGPSALYDEGRRWAGRLLSGVVVDHACALDEQDWEALRNIEVRCVRMSTSQ